MQHFDLRQSVRERYAAMGLVKLNGVFAPDALAALWREIQDFTGVSAADFAGVRDGSRKAFNAPGAILRNRRFWPLLQNDVIDDTLRFLVGDDVKFLGLDSMTVHWSSTGMHRDTHVDVAAFMNGEAPADHPYTVTRVLLHINDPAAEPYAFQFYPASHDVVMPGLAVHDAELHDLSRMLVATAVAPGDCLIFDARLQHTGVPIVSPKCFVTMTYGLPNLYSYDHFFYSRYIRVDQGLTDMEPALVEQLRARNTYLEGSANASLRHEFIAPYAHLEGTFDPDRLARDFIRDV